MAHATDLAPMLAKTLADSHLSRSERQALRAVIETAGLTCEDQVRYRAEAFRLARSALNDPQAGTILQWYEDVLELLTLPPTLKSDTAEAFFSPRDDCARQIVHLLDRTQRLLDICVFTITDDRIATAIIAAHHRGVQVRIVSDDQKIEDLGSDIDRLRSAGIPVRLDCSPAHMHHKFALLDSERLLVGSYNWTRGAANLNQENVILLDNRRLLAAFQAEFERLWRQFQ